MSKVTLLDFLEPSLQYTIVIPANSTNVWHLIELREAGGVWCVGSVVEDGPRTAGSLVTWPLSSSDVEAGLPHLHSPGHS